jgi:thiol:disulfide interchange protein DsbD
MRSLIWLAIVWLSAFGPSALAEGKTKARLWLAAETARPGDTVLAGVVLNMPAGWHTYWRNPGESGLATTITWTLPADLSAGEVQWPAPEKLVVDDLVTYVHDGEIVLLVPLKIAANAAPGPRSLNAKVAWLECMEACLLGEAQVQANLTVGSVLQPSAEAARLDAAQRAIPLPDPALAVRAAWTRPPTGETNELVISGATLDHFTPGDFLAYPSEAYEVQPAVKVLAADAGQFRLTKTVKRLGNAFPARIAGILWQPGRDGQPPAAREVELTPGSSEAAGVKGSLPIPVAPSGVSLLAMLGFAFLGGLILNIMPCVLPVIALKILGFVQQHKESPARVRQLGVMYAFGVLVSFLVLAGAVISVRQAGGAASWGMQMQNPFFRFALLLIVMLVTLNLFGVFEVTLSGRAMGAAAGLASKEGAAGAFFNGVLATALATPCTAPFLTVALGFAFTQSALVVVLMFVATALGLALPYVVLSCQPGWLKFLPKPGAWMLKFKVAMGFPMLATAVWLFDLNASSYGEGGVLWLGLWLTLLALALWVWGELFQRGMRRRGLAAATAFALVVFGYVYVLEGELDWRHPVSGSPAAGMAPARGDGIAWQPWSAAAVEQVRATGRPVLVDFTARWCLTCKANEKFALDVPSVRTKLKETGAVAFRADYTNPDPRITEELKRHGRAGVPLVVVFPKAANQPGIVLPATLTPGIVLEALVKAAQ